MKKEKKSARLTELLSRFEPPLCTEAMIELHGSRELLLSGCTGICDYSRGEILLSTVSGNLTVIGKRLELSVFRADILSVTGKIETVSFAGREAL